MVLCFVVVMQSFIMNSHEVFIHIHQGCFAGTGAIVRLPQCQWSKPDGYGKICQCITTTKHSKAKTVCIFLGIYCKRVVHVIMDNHLIDNRISHDNAYTLSFCMIYNKNYRKYIHDKHSIRASCPTHSVCVQRVTSRIKYCPTSCSLDRQINVIKLESDMM